jgi:hypothetical protein
MKKCKNCKNPIKLFGRVWFHSLSGNGWVYCTNEQRDLNQPCSKGSEIAEVMTESEIVREILVKYGD